MRKFTATDYLKIDIANSFGLDKEDWDIRLQWFENHKDQLHSLVKKAEEPAQFYAGVLAYEAALRNEPVGYIAKLDATASGIQILTCLIGCEQSAFHVNLTNASRQDAYTNNNRAINTKVSSGVVIERKDSKQALMTNMYGSEAVPKRVFGEDTPELAAFYEATEEQLPGVVKLNAILMGLWNPTALAHKWTLPDGFEVVVKVMNKMEVQVPFMSSTYACPVNVNAPKEKSKSLPANVTHSQWE